MSQHNLNRDWKQPVITVNQYPYHNQAPQLPLTVQQYQHWPPLPQACNLQDQRDHAHSRFSAVPNPRSATNSALFNHVDYLQGNPSSMEDGPSFGVGSDTSLLSPYGCDLTNEESWNTLNRRGSGTARSRFPSHSSYRTHRGPASDADSQVQPSDEGYTSQITRSVLSNQAGRPRSEIASPLMEQFGGMVVGSETPEDFRLPSDQGSRISIRSGRSKKNIQCPHCKDILKCNSDYNKHELKHTKPYKCDVPGCRRTEGFTTSNDLDRHKSSVHRQNINKKSYRCAAEDCRNKEKVWPRLDNFKQHVERMHSNENTLDLIKRSTCYPKEAVPSMNEETTVAPMDTSFAVTGMEKSFSTSPSIDSIPMLDLTEQEDRPWSSFEHSQDPASTKYPTSQDFSRPAFAPNNIYAEQRSESPHSQHCAPGFNMQTPQVHRSAPIVTNMESGQDTLSPSPSRAENLLSNAPQTKAEQQRSALSKFSEAISSPSNPVDLERFILNILHKATDSPKWDDQSPGQAEPGQADGNGTVLSKSDALKATQFISRLIKSSPGSVNTVQRRSNRLGFMSNPKICEHQGCDFRALRDCDLRKHMKRHKKPFGCTYPKCHKRFGAKSDWKRHENSQHFQLEAFRCAQILPSGDMCCVHLHREMAFRDHLDQQHKVSSVGVEELVRKNRIGKNCQGSFWCGFCKTVVELKTKRNAAWDERFDHIANHFEKQHRSIDEWICAEENKSKKELSREMNRYFYEDDDDREKSGDIDAIGEVDDDIPIPTPQPSREMVLDSYIPAFVDPPLQPEAMQVNSRKRSAPGDTTISSRPAKRTQRAPKIHYCCKCKHPCGPMDVQCPDCDHRVCNECDVEQTSNMYLYQ